MVLTVPLVNASRTIPLLNPPVVTNTSPAESTATPVGLPSWPDATVLDTVDTNVENVVYWNRVFVVAPCALTVALSVAPVPNVDVAEFVVTAGGAAMETVRLST